MIRCTPEEVIKAYRMLEEIDAIRRIEAAAHNINGLDFSEFHEVVLQKAAAMPMHSAARARITKLGEVFEQRMRQVHGLAASGDCFQRIFGIPPPPALGTAFGTYTVEFELGPEDYRELCKTLGLKPTYADSVGLCLSPDNISHMRETVGGSVVLLKRNGTVGPVTRRHEEVHGAQSLMYKAGYPQTCEVGWDLHREESAACIEENGRRNGRHLLLHTGLYAEHDIPEGHFRRLAHTLYPENAAAAQRFMDQRERVIDALAAAYETAGAERYAIGWALNLMSFRVADRKLHALAVAYQQR